MAGVAQQYLTFIIAEEQFAIPILAVQEIRGWERVTAVPRSPAAVLGVISLRGTVVPVVSLRTRLSLPATELTATTVVIVVRVQVEGGGTHTIGCVVDGVSDVVALDPETINPAPEACGSIDRTFIQGVAASDGSMVMLLDLPRLVGSDADVSGLPAGSGDADRAASHFA
jgi:purine-binding chemotaxis protein CheW